MFFCSSDDTWLDLPSTMRRGAAETVEFCRSICGGLTYTASINLIWKLSVKSKLEILCRVAEAMNLRFTAFTRRYLST